MAEKCGFELGLVSNLSDEVRLWYSNHICDVDGYVKESRSVIKSYNKIVDEFNQKLEEESIGRGASVNRQIRLEEFPEGTRIESEWRYIREYYIWLEVWPMRDRSVATDALAPVDYRDPLKTNYMISLQIFDEGNANAAAKEFYENRLKKQALPWSTAALATKGDNDKWWQKGNTLSSELHAIANNLQILWEELLAVAAKAEAKNLPDADDRKKLFDDQGNVKKDLAAQDAADAAQIKNRLAENALSAADGELTTTFANVSFSEQCFLLANVIDIAQHKKDLETKNAKKLPYYPADGKGPASLLIEGHPYGFINQLTQHAAQNKFFNMETKQISALQPMIRLYKIVEVDEKMEQQEFMFDSHASRADVESLFTEKDKRGFGVGIKEFNFTYDGSTMFSAKKSIKAQLKIFASSFDELLVTRRGDPKLGGKGDYRYADLALKTGKMRMSSGKIESAAETTCQTFEDVQENLEKLNFRLKAVVGWARPSGDTSSLFPTTETEKHKLLDAVNESYITINLTPTVHEFQIDDMGRVNFTINYLAYIDDFFDQSEFDIFYDEDALTRTMGRRIAYSVLTSACDNEDKIKEFKTKVANKGVIRSDKMKNMQSLIAGLEDANKMKYINIPYSFTSTFLSPYTQQENTPSIVGHSSELSTADKTSADLDKSYQDEFMTKQVDLTAGARAPRAANYADFATRVKTMSIDDFAAGQDEKTVSFFYVSDLVDMILEGINKRIEKLSDNAFWEQVWSEFQKWNPEARWGDDFMPYKTRTKDKAKRFAKEYERFRILLGPLELVNPANNEVGSPSLSKHVSFGDIPVSTKYFMSWLSDKLITRDQTEYYLSIFLKDFFEHLVRDFLSNEKCFSESANIKQKTSLNESVVTSYKDPTSGYDEITSWINKNFPQRASGRWRDAGFKSKSGIARSPRAYIDEMPRPILNVSGPHTRNGTSPLVDLGVENEINYLIYSAGRVQPKELQNGSRLEDEARGIFHYLIGRPQGIVKNINLTRAESKYLKVVRFEQEGFDGLQQLREVYNVEIDCFANVKTFPGTYIFVDPRGFAPNTPTYVSTKKGSQAEKPRPHPLDLTQYGIGGYCMIYRSEHSFAPGQANTKLQAAWVAAVDPADGCQLPTPSSGGDGSIKKNCKEVKGPIRPPKIHAPKQ